MQSFWIKSVTLTLFLHYGCSGQTQLSSSLPVSGRCPWDRIVFTCQTSVVVTWRWLWPNMTVEELGIYISSEEVNDMPRNVLGDYNVTTTLLHSNGTLRTSSLELVVSEALNGSIIYCSGEEKQLVLREPPLTPQNLRISMDYNFTNRSVVTLQWNYQTVSDVELFIISATPQLLNTLTTTLSINITLDYNVDYEISVVSMNCRGHSDAAVLNVTLVTCKDITSDNGVQNVFSSDVKSVGSEITFQCNDTFIPREEITAICGNNGEWYPSVNCMPECALNFSTTLEHVSTSSDGTTVSLRCRDGFTSPMEISGICHNGKWNISDYSCTPNTTNESSIQPTTCTDAFPLENGNLWCGEARLFTTHTGSAVKEEERDNSSIVEVDVLVGVVVGMAVLVVVALLCGVALGWMLSHQFHNKRQQVIVQTQEQAGRDVGVTEDHMIPMYEEVCVKEEDNNVAIQTSDNVAYGQTVFIS